MKTYGTLKYIDGFWMFSEVPAHVRIRMKNLFQGIPKHSVEIALKNKSGLIQDIYWFLLRYPMKMDKRTKEVLDAQKLEDDSRQQRMFEIVEGQMDLLRNLDMKKPLRSYQRQCLDLFMATKRLLVGDVVGLGKTVEALAAAVNKECLPALIVMQAHLQTQWEEKANEFTNLKVHKIKGTKPYTLPQADVYLIRYSCIAGWSDALLEVGLKYVAFDEIQELRRSDSAKHQAAKVIADSCEYVMGLSATPVVNYGDEIFNIYSVVNPGVLGSQQEFMREWTGYGRVVGNPKALGEFLRDGYHYLRRTMEDVGRELDPVNKIVHTIGYDEQEVKKTQDIARQLAMKATTASFVERGQAGRELDIMMRHMTGVSKARYVAEYVKILLQNDEQVLLGAWHRDFYDIVIKELQEYKPVLYTGTESPKEKEESKQKFLSGESRIMLISLRSGTGLDGLQNGKCKTVVFGELDWSPTFHEQLIGRLRRDDQKDQITAIFLVSDAGSDPVMVSLLGLKSSQHEGINNPKSSLEVVHSDDSRIKMLAQKVLESK